MDDRDKPLVNSIAQKTKDQRRKGGRRIGNKVRNKTKQKIFSSLQSVPMSTLRPLLLVTLLSCFFLSPTPTSATKLPSDSDKVSLAVYYESLCPYSANFIINYLPQLFENDLISIVDLTLVPYGNAKLRQNSTIQCQHGPYECVLNTIEACAIDAWPQLSEHFPFIYCIESLVHERKYAEWESCYSKLGLDATPITECYESDRGMELELKYAAETDALQPPHKYVPWVVVDGQPLYEDYENFISYICEAYKGTSVLKACAKSSALKTYVRESAKVCWREMIEPSLSARVVSVLVYWAKRMTISSI